MKRVCILLLLGLLSLFPTRAGQSDTLPRITGFMLHRGIFTGLDVKRCDSLRTLICPNRQLRTIQGSSRVLQSFHAANNHLPLSQLYPFMQRCPDGARYRLSPQTDTIQLLIDQDMDLHKEMTIGSSATEWNLMKRNGTEAPDGTCTETNGIFRFVKGGEYKLILKNDALKDQNEGTNNLVEFVWYVNVKATNYTLTIRSNNSAWGTVSGNGTYEEGADATIVATAKSGYRFVNWKKGDSVFGAKADTTFKIMENLTLTAYFEKPTANEDVQENKFFVYAENKAICLSEPMGRVQVFNAAGQCVYTGSDTKILVRTSGLYVVRTRTRSYKVTVK